MGFESKYRPSWGVDDQYRFLHWCKWQYWWFLFQGESVGAEAEIDDFLYLLNPELRPIAPYPNSKASSVVYEEHKAMAKKYLEVQKDIESLTRYKAGLVQELQSTRKQKEQQRLEEEAAAGETDLQRSVEEYVKLQNERENLVKLHRNLKEQLTRLRAQHSQQQSSQHQQQQQQQQRSRSPIPDDGWVVLSRT